MRSATTIQASLLTDVGRARTRNQDTLRVCEPNDRSTLSRSGRLYIVADGAGGVGGAMAGRVASRYAAAKVQELYYRSTRGSVGDRLRAAIEQTSDEFRQHLERPGRMKQMATTLVAAGVRGNHLTIANVGDSRAYLARGDTIQQVTEDHSLVAGLLADGVITPEEAAEHPQRNVLLSSLGSAPDEPRVDIYTRRLQPGDAVLLCTDGLTRYTSDDQLLALLSEEPEDQAAQRLIDFANAAGGSDNVTVAVLRATRASRAWWRWRLLIGALLVVISGFLGLALAALGLIDSAR